MRYWNGYLRPEFNKTGMKQITNTGFKTFDKQNNLVATGNVLSNCQTSFYLDDYAIKIMPKHWHEVNSKFLQNIANLSNNKVVFYEFFVWYNDKKSVFYQAAVDDATGNKVWSRLLGGRGNRNKRRLASKWIDMYITKKEEV